MNKPGRNETSGATGSSLGDGGFATVEEAGRFLALGRTKVYGLMDAGELRSVKIGKARRIPWQALKDFARRAVEAAA